MARDPKKSEEFKRFETLTKRVVRVPKEEVDQKEKERPKRQRRPKEPGSS
jgi:hypothetical protein